MESTTLDFRDLQQQESILHSKVQMLTSENTKLEGYVYTIDPITNSFVLFANGHLITIFGHAISSVKIIIYPDSETKTKLNSLLDKNEVHFDQETLLEKKQNLINWLTKNRLDIEIDDEIIHVSKGLQILPPYESENCLSTNEIILSNVQKIIKALPHN